MHVSNPRTFWKWIFLAVAMGVVAIVILTPPLVYLIDGNDPATRGTFGDMFGVTNALFSGLAFAGLIVTIFMQRSEIQLQRQEFIRSVDTQAALLEVARSEQRDREAREHRAATLVLGEWKKDKGTIGINDSPVELYTVMNKGQSVTQLTVAAFSFENAVQIIIENPEVLPAGSELSVMFVMEGSIHKDRPKLALHGSSFSLGYVDANGDRRQQAYTWRGAPLGFYCTDLGFDEKPGSDSAE